MSTVLAIDPGPVESAWVLYDGAKPKLFGKYGNDRILEEIKPLSVRESLEYRRPDALAIEMIASYGMPVGREVFETCVWIGRFVEAWGGPHTFVYRRDVKLHLCGNVRAKDGNVRQALIDRYGGKDKAIGKKKTPGPLFGVSADVWSALAVAVTHADAAVSS